MILISWAAGTPSACERSRTVTPDGTVTGPVGCAGVACLGLGSVRSRGWRESCRGRAAPLSMTTRRRAARRDSRGGGWGGWVCSVRWTLRQSV